MSRRFILRFIAVWASVLAVVWISWNRERRRFEPVPPVVSTRTDWEPAKRTPLPAVAVEPPPPNYNNAYAVSEGHRLFEWFNCVGCHGHGGGGMGPPLMDADSILGGGDPRVIFSIVATGTPNGMPRFGDKIPVSQIWQIVAYVQSLSGVASQIGATPVRSDHMEFKTPERLKKSNRSQEATESRAAEDASLETYGWVDRAAGIARIPIGRAMALLAKRSLPTEHHSDEDKGSPTTLRDR